MYLNDVVDGNAFDGYLGQGSYSYVYKSSLQVGRHTVPVAIKYPKNSPSAKNIAKEAIMYHKMSAQPSPFLMRMVAIMYFDKSLIESSIRNKTNSEVLDCIKQISSVSTPIICPALELWDMNLRSYLSSAKTDFEYVFDYLSAFHVLLMVCQGIREIHERGFVHRDIGVDNVQVEVKFDQRTSKRMIQRAVISDFGIMCEINEDMPKNDQFSETWRKTKRNPDIMTFAAPLADLYSVGYSISQEMLKVFDHKFGEVEREVPEFKVINAFRYLTTSKSQQRHMINIAAISDREAFTVNDAIKMLSVMVHTLKEKSVA
jgi:serine/threonine protein kinase